MGSTDLMRKGSMMVRMGIVSVVSSGKPKCKCCTAALPMVDREDVLGEA